MTKKLTRPISPLQAMTLKAHEFNQLTDVPHKNESSTSQLANQVLQVDTFEIQNWIYHDRPEQELGDLNQLAEDIKYNGQQNPCIVRPSQNSNFKYELIAGERRWRACKIANIKVAIIIKNLNDTEAALCQASENSHRKDLSDYAKGISFHRLLSNNILTQRDLATKLNKSQSYIRNLLAFEKIPKQIVALIGNIHTISGATAYEIARLADKGQIYLDALIKLAPQIGFKINNDKKIQSEVEKYLNKNKKELTKTPIVVNGSSGKHLFSWKYNLKGPSSISFAQDIIKMLDIELIEKDIINAIEKQLQKK